MKNGWIRLCIISLVLGLLYGVACFSWQMKRDALEDVYQTVQFSLTKVEAQQYVNQIEYGMQYGKTLTSFFKMDELLRDMHMSSSYLQGVYVIDDVGRTVNSSTNTMLPPIEEPFVQTGQGIAEARTDYGVTYIALDINDETGTLAGQLVLKLNTDAGGNLLETDWQNSWLRTLVIMLYFGAAAVIFFVRFPVKKQGSFRLLLLSAIVLATVVAAQGVDMALESAWASQKIEISTTRSAQRIAQVLQTQIDDVQRKGVTYEDIGTLDAYFAKSAESINTVDGFALDINNRVTATPSRAFMDAGIAEANRVYLNTLGMTAAAAAIAWLLIAGLQWCWRAYSKRRVRQSAAPEAEEAPVLTNEQAELEQARQMALQVLEHDPIQNGMLINRLKNGYVSDIGVLGGNVRLFDTRDRKYMFAATDYDAFCVLYHTARREPQIFYINTNAYQDKLPHTRFYTVSLVQMAKITPLTAEQTEIEGYTFGPVEEQDIPFIMQTYISPEFNQANVLDGIRSGPTVVVRHNGKTIGYLITHRDGETGPMYLLPEHRGKRIGRELVLRMTKLVLDMGDVPLFNVERDNWACIKPHEEFGYEKAAQEILWVYPTTLGMVQENGSLMPEIGSVSI